MSEPTAKPAKAMKPYACREYAVQCVREFILEGAVDKPEQVFNLWQKMVPSAPWYLTDREMMVVFMMNARRRCTGIYLANMGTLDTIYVHSRDVFRQALIVSAHAIVIAHNHPSGDPTPSEADIKVTRDLIRAGQLLKVEVLDHIIVGDTNEGRIKPWSSLRELGYFYS